MIDFQDTATCFKNTSNSALRKMYFLFSLMNKRWLVSWGIRLILCAVRLRFPMPLFPMYSNIFNHFCAGENLKEVAQTARRLRTTKVASVLVYGVENKLTEEGANKTFLETMQMVDAAKEESISFISVKITGLIALSLLEKIQQQEKLSKEENVRYYKLQKRLLKICARCEQANISVMFDAEETWIQGVIDGLLNKLMRKFNQQRPVVYNTYQMYLRDRNKYLSDCVQSARKNGYYIGVKLVRGAYMEKEAAYAEKRGKPSPVHPTIEETHESFNQALKYCLQHIDIVALCNASHNQRSCELQIQLMKDMNIPNNHPHILFCQLYGMGDYLTYNLAAHNYYAAKYLIYGKKKEVVHYLIRRAQENTSVSNTMSRELNMLHKERMRRKIEGC